VELEGGWGGGKDGDFPGKKYIVNFEVSSHFDPKVISMLGNFLVGARNLGEIFNRRGADPGTCALTALTAELLLVKHC